MSTRGLNGHVSPCAHYLSISDFEHAARRRLPASVFGYVSGGTQDEVSLNANRAVFDRLAFLPRGLRDVSMRSQTVSLWGKTYASPIGLAPTGINAMVCHDADALLAEQAHLAVLPFVISGASNVPLERLAKLSPGSWYQAYFPGDRIRIEKIVQRLEAAAIDTLVVTIDTCVGANRENNIRNHFSVPFRFSPSLLLDGILHPRWSFQVFAKSLLNVGIPRFSNMDETVGSRIIDDTPEGFRAGRDQLDWDTLAWLRGRWRGKLLLKGVVHPSDALLAVTLGVDGIIVSNHGGRQLDSVISPLQALPGVLAQVPRDFPVMVDGGFRRGTDVLKAVALGARLVFLGRPPLYGAAVAGSAGIQRVLEIFKTEIDRDLALLGCRSLSDVSADLLSVFGSPALNERRTR
jgi:L-lactate dehydrogenase (cytochrome)